MRKSKKLAILKLFKDKETAVLAELEAKEAAVKEAAVKAYAAKEAAAKVAAEKEAAAKKAKSVVVEPSKEE